MCKIGSYAFVLLIVLVCICGYVPVFAETIGQDVVTTERQENFVDPTYAMIKNNLEAPLAVLDKLSKGENVPKEIIERAKKNLDEAANLIDTLTPGKNK